MTDHRYPVLLDLSGRPCLVVGGGAVAARKVEGLLGAGAVVTVVSPTLHPDLAARLADGTLNWHERGFEPDDVGDEPAPRWALVVVATADKDVNRLVVEQAASRGILVNDATDPTGGPAAVPAVLRDGPLTLTVSTGGRSPGAAAWIRDLIETEQGPRMAMLLRVLDEVSGMCQETERLDWRKVRRSGMLDSVREGREAEAKERLFRCLSSSSD